MSKCQFCGDYVERGAVCETHRAVEPAIEIPMCWKCKHAIMETQVSALRSCKKIVGCTAEPQVTDYQTAQKHCPLLGKGVAKDE